MFYKPQQINRLWDTWMYHHDGVFYLYHLVTDCSPGEAICLATSYDGVHWHERGVIFEKSEEAAWLGTGSIWPHPTESGRWIMNFSEWLGPFTYGGSEGQQVIRFAVSDDLVHWTRLGESFDFHPDARFYRKDEGESSRWDCIYSFEENGRRFGYWTANPKEFHPGVGFGVSDDGLKWQAQQPPHIEWIGTPRMSNMEAGAVERIGDKYFILAGTWDHHEGKFGIVTFVAQNPQGPFRPAERNFFLLASPSKSAYFARFFPLADEMLANHHVMTRDDVRYFAPLKRAVCGEDGTLRFHFWPENEAAKGEQVDVACEAKNIGSIKIENQVLQISSVTKDLPWQNGLWLETYLQRNNGAVGLGIACEDNQVLTMLLQPDNSVLFGVLSTQNKWQLEDTVQRDSDFGEAPHVRLLVRETLLELYLEDVLIHCYHLTALPTGSLQWLHGGKQIAPRIEAWPMNFLEHLLAELLEDHSDEVLRVHFSDSEIYDLTGFHVFCEADGNYEECWADVVNAVEKPTSKKDWFADAGMSFQLKEVLQVVHPETGKSLFVCKR